VHKVYLSFSLLYDMMMIMIGVGGGGGGGSGGGGGGDAGGGGGGEGEYFKCPTSFWYVQVNKSQNSCV
jgi:hypothetical protein